MDLFICSKCGANLIEVGIKEVLVGGCTETDITFTKEGEKKVAKIGKPETIDFDEQWVVCLACNQDLQDRTAIEIIDAYENDELHITD